MDPQPGPSRIKDSSPGRPKKKYKIENLDDVGFQSSSVSIDDLPDEILIEIFSYLSVQDRMKAQNMCDRWSQLLRSKVFWKYVNMTNISNSFFIEVVAQLPACVSQLRLVCRSEALPISLPELFGKLHDQCPCLESLYLGNIDLLKNLHTEPTHRTRRHELYNNILLEDAKNTLDEHSNHIIESEFQKEEDIGLTKAVLPQLKILSLRRVLFSQFHILSHISNFVLPKIVVLDLSFSQPLSLKKIYLFSSLSDLEELYLAAWKIPDITIVNFIRNSNKLRVLDLEHCRVTEKTVLALKRYCTLLEELYLAFCPIGDISKNVEDEDFFPCLKTLCLRHTKVTKKGIERLITECPSLKHVYVGDSETIDDPWYRGLSEDFKEKITYHPDEMIYYCDHFSMTKYYKF